MLIGVGNNLLESLLEWVSERIEKLTHREIVHRNAVIYAEARYKKFKKDYDTWIQNDRIKLTNLKVQKVSLAFMLAERVRFICPAVMDKVAAIEDKSIRKKKKWTKLA